MTYDVVDITPDTPEWEQERRNSIGASETAAILGLSKWSTPLAVYLSKMGKPSDFDPELSYVTHALEPVVKGWVERFHPEWGTVEPGFMARSTEHPHLHGSFDFILVRPDGYREPLQVKTGHQNAKSSWDNGVPTEYLIQEQQEIYVFGSQSARLVVMHGGRTFDWYDIQRDEEFIQEHLIPKTKEFWEKHVLAEVAPEPTTISEVAEVYPSQAGTVIEGSETVADAVSKREVLLSDAKALTEEADLLTLAIAQYMGEAETLTINGQPVVTYKTQAGRKNADIKLLESEYPEVAAAVIKQGNPFKVMRKATGKKDK